MNGKRKDSLEVKVDAIDVFIDYGELGIDALMESGALKEIPILKTILGAKDGFKKIQHHIYNKKVQAFIEGLRVGLDRDDKAIDSFMKEEKERQKFVETAFILIERYDDIHKPEVMGLLWAACAKGSISYAQVARLCHLIDKVYWDDLLVLLNFKDGVQASGEIGVESLCSAGLLARGGIDGGTFGSPDQKNNPGGHYFTKTDLGCALVLFGLEKFKKGL